MPGTVAWVEKHAAAHKARSPRLLATVWAVALFALLLAVDTSLHQSVTPGADVSYDIPWVLQMLQTHTPVFFGGASAFGPGHPGPWYLWLITAGYGVAGYLGSYLVYILAAFALWSVAAVALSRAFASTAAGYGFVLALALSDRFEQSVVGSSLTWMESPVIALAALTAALAAMFATPTRWRWAAPVALLTGLLSVSIWVNTAPIALLPIIAGAVWLRRSGRTEKALGVSASAVLLLPLVLRWVQGGAAFPVRYLKEILRFRRSNSGGRLGEAAWAHMHQIWFGLPQELALALWVVVIVVTAIGAARGKTAPRLAFVAAVLLTLYTISVPSLEESHIVTIGSLLPECALAAAVAVVAKRARYDRARVEMFVSLSCMVLAVIVISTTPVSSQRFVTATQHAPAAQQAASVLLSDARMSSILRREVIEMSDSAAISQMTRLFLQRPLWLELRRAGSEVCWRRQPPAPGYGGVYSDSSVCPSAPRFQIVVGEAVVVNSDIVGEFTVRDELTGEVRVRLLQRRVVS